MSRVLQSTIGVFYSPKEREREVVYIPFNREETLSKKKMTVTDEALDLAPTLLQTFLHRTSEKESADGETTSIFIADLGELRRVLQNWRRLLPAIQPYYGR